MSRRGDIAFIKFFEDLPHYTYMCYGIDDNNYSYYVCLDYEYYENVQLVKGLGIPYKVRTQEKRTVLDDEYLEIIDDDDMEKMRALDTMMEAKELKCGCEGCEEKYKKNKEENGERGD